MKTGLPTTVSQTWPLEAKLIQRCSAYLALTKPTLQLLVVLTGAAALVVEGSLVYQPVRFGLALLLLGLSAGSAKALNQYLERDLDRLMERTRLRRPLPRGLISPTEALAFAMILGGAAILGFGLFFNPLSALLCAFTILFYSFFYTLYLKPRTPYSIVIGGIAGGMGPVISWVAAGGAVSVTPWLMLALICFWTPAHFWILALLYQEDFRRTGYPMLPVQVGEARTWRAILRYALLTMLCSLGFKLIGTGWFFVVAAAVLGGIYLGGLHWARRRGTPQALRLAFHASIVYLMALCGAMILDRLL